MKKPQELTASSPPRKRTGLAAGKSLFTAHPSVRSGILAAVRRPDRPGLTLPTSTRLALLRRRALLALATAAAALLVLGVGSARAAGAIVVPKFKNVSTKAGVAVQEPDATCGAWVTGAAWGDVNADGWPDLYVARLDQPTELFLNNRHGGFSGDVAAKYGVQSTGATGVVFADYDNDGRPDLYVVREGPDVLYHNDGHGHFSDVTAQAGISDNYFGSSVSFADFNNDGYLDIYVTNYAQCGYPSSSLFNYQPDKLYQNNGNGTFTDVTSLLGVNPANGLGRSRLVRTLTVTWPSGLRQVLRNVKTDRLLKIVEPKV